MPYHSILELDFAAITNGVKNEKRFIIFQSKQTKKIHVTYQPDFIFLIKNQNKQNLICWVEVKGYHKNMQTYLLKRRLITDYCLQQKIVFLEFRFKKKAFICTYSSNKYLIQ